MKFVGTNAGIHAGKYVNILCMSRCKSHEICQNTRIHVFHHDRDVFAQPFESFMSWEVCSIRLARVSMYFSRFTTSRSVCTALRLEVSEMQARIHQLLQDKSKKEDEVPPAQLFHKSST